MQLSLENVVLLFAILHGLVVSGLIVFSGKKKSLHNRFLFILVFFLVLTLSISFVGNSKLVKSWPFYTFIPFDFRIFFPPLIYLYVRSFIDSRGVSSFRTCYPHFVVPVTWWIYSFIIWLLTIPVASSGKGEIASSWYYLDLIWLRDLWLVASLLVYGFMSLKATKLQDRNKLNNIQSEFIKWIKPFVFLLFLGALVDVLSMSVGKSYGYWKGSPIDDWLGISLPLLVKNYYALLLYVLAFWGFYRFSSKLSTNGSGWLSIDLESVDAQIKSEEYYLSPGLSLPILAANLRLNPTNLSSSLKMERGLNYNDYINSFRVEAFKEKVQLNTAENFTLEAVAQSVGFKSRSTFYRAFRKFEGCTPKSYLAQQDINATQVKAEF